MIPLSIIVDTVLFLIGLSHKSDGVLFRRFFDLNGRREADFDVILRTAHEVYGVSFVEGAVGL